MTRRYEINLSKTERLRILKDYEFVLLLDDSGSMKTPVDDGRHTRWGELCMITKIVLEIGTIFDQNGVDLYFLNRQCVLRVKNPSEVDEAFVNPPSGYTPLAQTLYYLLQQVPAARRGNDKKLLLFIATDGEPTDNDGNPNLAEFEHIMSRVRNPDTTHVMFLLCTDEPSCVNYLTQWTQTMRNVGLTDDFRTEKEKFRNNHGPNLPFSLGDYVVKAVIGAIDTDIDLITEPHEQDDNTETNNS